MDNTPKRAGKKQQKKKKEKELLQLQRELYDIYDEIKSLGVVKLEKPYKKGYKKTFRLKTEYRSLGNSKELKQVLRLINDVKYCPIKDFASYKYYTPLCHEPKLHYLYGFQFVNISKNLKEYFTKVTHRTINNNEITTYHVIHPEYYEPFVYRHFIKEIKAIDPQLEKRKTELENYIKSNNLWPQIFKLTGLPTSGGKNRIFNHYDKKAIMEKLSKKDLELYFDLFED